jgi:uncharacterized iron-regulated membrane protein
MMFFLVLLCIFIAVSIISVPVLRFVRNLLPTQGIANDKTRRLADAGITSGVWVTLYAVAFAIVGLPFSLFSFVFCFALLTVLEYFMPSRRV